MGKTRVEERGRVLIPKEVREELGLRGGEEVRVREKDGSVVIKPVRSVDEIEHLRGCVKESEIDPLELKEMWEM
ncbi:MAG: AbrB/MazE/SpoVT family DNA-binding domain-containing protein [Candidatus Nanohaloarchaea archaeon]|nr:AbrB/MazE/SpoVT family DNA-binding domain-containing protein [Candidatus Nanohaloarchaea archaeon]